MALEELCPKNRLALGGRRDDFDPTVGRPSIHSALQEAVELTTPESERHPAPGFHWEPALAAVRAHHDPALQAPHQRLRLQPRVALDLDRALGRDILPV